MRLKFVVAMLGPIGLAAPALADGWRLAPRSADRPLELTLSTGDRIAYRLECGAADVAVTQFGVTKLLDLKTNTPVGDSPGSTMAPGASMMALATDKAEPNMVPASATPNANKGWDMTIRIAKDDPAFRSLARAGMVSLFTTGYTEAVVIGKADRKLLADFVKQCRAG